MSTSPTFLVASTVLSTLLRYFFPYFYHLLELITCLVDGGRLRHVQVLWQQGRREVRDWVLRRPVPARHQVHQRRGTFLPHFAGFWWFTFEQANVVDWQPSPNDTNAGTGKYGTCCNEMDIWEANSQATAVTPHTCTSVGQVRTSSVVVESKLLTSRSDSLRGHRLW